MAYVITDLNDFEIQISDGFRDIVIWKQNIRFGDIVGDDLTIYWHNKAQTDTRYQLTIDWNDVTAPVVVSAADLQTKLEGFIASGWGGGGSGISLSAGGVTVSNGTVVFSNANSVTFGMAGSTVTASVSSPAQSEYLFSNANGVSFGTAGSTVTASHNGITSQSVQTQNAVSVLGSTGDISFANSNGITFGGNASTITASYTVPTVTNSSWTASAGTQSATVSQLVWSNSNGVSFGLDNGTITASHNGLTTQTVQPVAVSGSNGSFSFNTLTAGNLNGLSFYTSNGSLVGSYTVPSVTNSSWTASAGTQSATISQLVFSDLNGVSFGLNNGTVTASHNGVTSQTSQPINISITGINTISATSGSGYNFSLSFDNLSAGISGNTIRVSHQRDTHTITAANGSATYGNQFGMFNLNGVSFSTTDSGGIRGFVASHNGISSQSNQALSGSNGSFAFQTATFGNLNGISFYTSNGSLVASHNGVTSQTVQPVALSGSNGSFSFSTVTFGNLNGISFYTSNGSVVASYTVPAGGSPAISGSNGSFTFNTVTFGNLNGASFYSSNGSMVLSYTVPAAGGALSFSAGTSSGTYNSLVLSNANGVSFGLNGSTVTASGYNDITLSLYPDRMPVIAPQTTLHSGVTGNTGGSTQITASYYVASVQIPHPIVFSSVWGFNLHSAIVAGTGSNTIGHAVGLYSLDANTALSLVSSWQWQMYVSQNSTSARSHKWFWGTDPSANSTGLSGNVSASFTNAGGAAFARKILLGTGNWSLPAGQYYWVSAYTARSGGSNVFQAGSLACMDNNATVSYLTMIGESSISQALGFNGVFSSTTNVSTIGVPILPSTVNTNAITLGATASGTHRTPIIIFERSKS